jgi:hypothetical protein
LEDHCPVTVQMLIVNDTGFTAVEDPAKPPLTLLQWCWPQIFPVDLQQVKGKQKHGVIVRLAVQLVKQGNSIRAADHTFAIEIERCGLDLAGGLDYRREAFGPVGTTPGVNANLVRRFPNQQPIAIVLDFVQPLRPGRNSKRDQ